MTAPANTIFADGGAPVSGDNLNSFVQTVNTMSDLRAFIGVTGMQAIVLGQSSVDDGQGGHFYWNANGTAADDNGVTTVLPSGSGSGEWTRLSLPSAATGGIGGQWTPRLFGATATGTPGYSLQSGYYRQGGGVVTAFFTLTLTSLGGISGLLEIGGLPLPANASSENSGGAFMTDYSGLTLTAGCFYVAGIILPDSVNITLTQFGLNTALNVSDANLGISPHFRGVAIYQSP